VLAAARALAAEQREHDAERPVHAGAGVVGDEVQREYRLAAGLADQPEDAREGEVVAVMGGVIAVRPVLAEAGQRAVDDARVDRLHALVVGAEPLHHAGAKALDEDVGLRGELLQDRLALGSLEVEGERALVAIHVDEGRPTPPVLVLGLIWWCVDLQHLGAHVREEHSGQFGRWHARKLENLDAVEDSHDELLDLGWAPGLSPAQPRRNVTGRSILTRDQCRARRGCRPPVRCWNLAGRSILARGQSRGHPQPWGSTEKSGWPYSTG
jgi:hypothetical protein